MHNDLTRNKLEARIHSLINRLKNNGGFDVALIIDKVNQYYYTGTMQDGVLAIRDDGSFFYYVRKSYQRAVIESPLKNVIKIRSYRDMLNELPENPGCVYLELNAMPVAMLHRFQRVFKFEQMKALDPIILAQRAVKDADELELIRESGRQHKIVMNEIIPSLLQEDMSETDFLADLYQAMVKLGYQGLSRFGMFQMEMVIGQMGFGDHSLYPTNFDGPGGMRGMSPAVPVVGSRERRLQKGDLVFVDVGYGVAGYHSDKTQVYSYGCNPSDDAVFAHAACRQVMEQLTSRLIAGAIPEQIYNEVSQNLPKGLTKDFMGMGEEAVRFFGHGVGLQIDEMPIIAVKQKQPLLENMVVALEPKCGLPGLGMVGVEETFLVRHNEPECLTGGDRDIMVVS